MWILLLLLSATVHTFASKERLSLRDLPKDEKDILIELVKRLGQGNELDQLGWKDTAQCEVKPNKSVIIKKKESLANGALFLKLYKDVESNEACSDLCCQNMSCDMALFENKNDHYCYLFQCGGNCTYSHHSNYIKNDVIRHFPQPPPLGDGSEQDLIDLDPGSDLSKSKNDDSLKTVPVTATLVSTTTAGYNIRAHSVGLEGPYCELNVHCEDPEAVCNYHKCRCRDGFYKKGHICRQVCPPSNFECLERGTLGRGPQCVTEKQVCDSIMQCADGSDEYNCPDSEGSYKGYGVLGKDEKPADKDDALISENPKQDSSDEDDRAGQSPKGKPTEDDDNTDKSAVSDTDTNKSSENTGVSDENSSNDVPPSKPDTDSQEETGGSSDESASSKADDADAASNSDSTSEEEIGKGDSFDKPSKQGEKGMEKESLVEDLLKSQDEFISRQRVTMHTLPTSMQGPIIALSLGLAFTVILLIFVACRLRTVRHRLRKGRPLHSNEADYLINGMYL